MSYHFRREREREIGGAERWGCSHSKTNQRTSITGPEIPFPILLYRLTWASTWIFAKQDLSGAWGTVWLFEQLMRNNRDINSFLGYWFR